MRLELAFNKDAGREAIYWIGETNVVRTLRTGVNMPYKPSETSRAKENTTTIISRASRDGPRLNIGFIMKKATSVAFTRYSCENKSPPW